MKRLILLLMSLITYLNINAQQQKGGWSLGYTGGGSFKTDNGFLSIDYRYNLTNNIRISPSVRTYFKKYGYKGTGADMDIHYVFPFSEYFNVYPFLGTSFSYWDFLNKKTKAYDKGKASFGGNIGFGAEVNVIDDIVISIDAKYNYTEINKQAMIGIRIAYIFN